MPTSKTRPYTPTPPSYYNPTHPLSLHTPLPLRSHTLSHYITTHPLPLHSHTPPPTTLPHTPSHYTPTPPLPLHTHTSLKPRHHGSRLTRTHVHTSVKSPACLCKSESSCLYVATLLTATLCARQNMPHHTWEQSFCPDKHTQHTRSTTTLRH